MQSYFGNIFPKLSSTGTEFLPLAITFSTSSVVIDWGDWVLIGGWSGSKVFRVYLQAFGWAADSLGWSSV